ncbi:MAG: ABC transporter ATP-binding protein [Bifidobacteriaceae bacterium]|nr:ABC transporter ATP-binding protein [Bifidobacteriaceae bacterium]
MPVLNGIDLTVDWGTMTGIVGPSGSGKSTLLYCLAGLEPPSSGHVSLLGASIDHLSQTRLAQLRREDIGFVFQSYNLVPSMTVQQNVALPFVLRRVKPPRQRIAETLSRLGLAHRGRARPVGLSGGEQQRVALAKVLVAEPAIVFADEPTGALDQAAGATVVEELRRVADSPMRAVLLVTHSPQVADRCDRVVSLVDGRIGGAR